MCQLKYKHVFTKLTNDKSQKCTKQFEIELVLCFIKSKISYENWVLLKVVRYLKTIDKQKIE